MSEDPDVLLRYLEAIMTERDLRYQQRFDAQQGAIAAALLAAEKAVTKAETAAEKRFESVNEFRSTLSDQASQFVTRTEAEARFTALTEKIDNNTKMIDRNAGRSAGMAQLWGVLIAVITVVIAIITVVIIVSR